MEVAQKPKSDLGVRTASAVVMVAVAGFVFWYGGLILQLFVISVAFGLLFEWWSLVIKIAKSGTAELLWWVAGFAYVGNAAYLLPSISMSQSHSAKWDFGFLGSLGASLIFGVIATDVGAYLVGRSFGGPKIAPSVSPSKTWSGLIGGMLLAGLVVTLLDCYIDYQARQRGAENQHLDWIGDLAFGGAIAVVAQLGDFFESWMKRKAGVKDSGKIIPGHGGLLDRVDGLLAVLFGLGCAIAIEQLTL